MGEGVQAGEMAGGACFWGWSLSNVPFYTGSRTEIQGWSSCPRRDLPRPKGVHPSYTKSVLLSRQAHVCVLVCPSSHWVLQRRLAAQAATRSGLSGCLDSTRHGLKMTERLTWGADHARWRPGGFALQLRPQVAFSGPVGLGLPSPPLPSLPSLPSLKWTLLSV